MRDTPRTDALPVSDPMTEREAALFQHARTLERELVAAQTRIAELEKENAAQQHDIERLLESLNAEINARKP